MVMKDKLEKTNHKGIYYAFRRFSLSLLAVASVAFVIAIPTYIINQAKKKNIGIAQETSSEVIEEVEEGESSEYESYND